MKKYNQGIRRLLYIGISLMQTTIMGYNSRPPRLTVVLVVDQFAHHYIGKLMPHLKHGLKYLFKNGVVYTNAHMPHGQPGTATGHAGLNTGTCAKDHGFTSNAWYTNGKKVSCDDDDSGNALVLSADGTYDYGKSAHLLMVDGLSDQCVLQSEPRSRFAAYSISGKSRSAIAASSKLGKPLWFDNASGRFTSSKAFFDTLPEWVEKFNNDNDINCMDSIMWKRMYPQSPYAYNFYNINNYDYARTHTSMLNRSLPIRDEEKPRHPYHFFEKTPQSNQRILDCAHACIKAHVSRKHRDRLLLWVCLSPLDKVSHQYGPDSLEAIDMIYHLDKQIQRFMRKTLRVIGKHEVIFALTSDHGVMPIPELLHKKGLTQARRIDRLEFTGNINQKIESKHSLANVVINHKGQELVLNASIMERLTPKKRLAVINDIKLYAMQEPGIRNAWAYDEFIRIPTLPNTLEDNIKNQLFRGRSGSVIIQTEPYNVITHWPEGSSHKTPYDYDTHVPLIIFHPGKFERRYVRKRVAALQLANTLAEILNVPKPSASTYEILPDLFDPEYQ
jgi:predicted AlkP superfamily pyrophosphatase or phosphodiesterase